MGFLDNFSGGKSRSDLRAANNKANQSLDAGYGQSQGYYDQARAGFQPYAEGGQQGWKMYQDLLGLNGADARSAAQGIITSDPQWQAGFAADSNAMLRAMNARGQGAGGAAALAGQRVLAENYGNAMNRYMGLGQQGMQAQGAMSDLFARQGDNAYGYGATKAANAINFGNAMAGTRNTGMNNLMGLMGAGLNAYKAYTAGQ